MDNIGSVRSININEEMRGSYLDYAMSVIVARALPDARDGLKPVHRRILYAMYDMGLRSNAPYKKSARLVGEVLGKYHPHGDQAVYDAMVRMAQPFSLRYPLIDGQGNFGSVDGDGAAAMRYTEARMATIAEELLVDINMNTVDFTDNYDGTQLEPTVLPARLPNLLLNGASGIAVGMATNIPPHNLRELAAAITYMIDNYDRVEDITVDELMEFVKGPDFPTGASIIANNELKEAYATGRGRVVIRATATIEEDKNEQLRIVFTDIPYQVSKAAIIERIVALARDGRLDMVRDLRDESDRDGLRLVVELKRGAQPRTVLNQLYKYSQLQSNYGIQLLALVKGEPRNLKSPAPHGTVDDVPLEPRNLSLRRALQIYIEHRCEVIKRRAEFELDKLRARKHILEGLLKAVSNIDLIIQTIRASADVDTARAQLQVRFELTEAQANAILEMQLRRLAALERQKLEQEYEEVLARIAHLEDLLSSPYKILQVVREDINQLAEKFGDERRSQIIYGNAEFDESELVRKEAVLISLTRKGYVKRVPATAYRAQRRGGKGVIGISMNDEDMPAELFYSNSLDTLLFFTDKGKVYSEKTYRLTEGSRAGKGSNIRSVLNLNDSERITAVLPVQNFDQEEAYFVMATKQGRIKRMPLHKFADVRPSGIIAIHLHEGDTLNWVKQTTGDQYIVIVTEQGQSICFHEEEVRVMGRTAAGVNAIKLLGDDKVAGMDVIREDSTHILVVTAYGYGKRTAIEDYSIQGRYGIGARTLARNNRTGPLVATRCINERDGIMLMTRNGIVLRTSLNEIRETGRSTQGVSLMDVNEDDQVVSVAILPGANAESEEMMLSLDQNGALSSDDGATA